MRSFVEEVALRLYEKYGDEVSSLTIAMPSLRARLFFAEALSAIAIRPIWEPQYISMDDIMGELSGLHTADRLRLVAELYKIFTEESSKRGMPVEKFDSFYHWGEMLVSDFDMVDKYRVNASQLFANITDIKEIEADLSYLSPEHIEIIERFWRTLYSNKDAQSAAKRKFTEIWGMLAPMYEAFKSRLRELGIGYSGMIYRDAVERLERGEAVLPNRRYAFVGFNALSKCESALLDHLKTSGMAEFYWDEDDYYTRDKQQEAGMFIRANRQLLSGEEGISHDNFRKAKHVEVLSTSTSIAQCQYVVKILEDIASRNGGKIDKDTAVVLTDENLLLPLLYALPTHLKERVEVKNGVERIRPAINVTMGYPLRNTLAYSFVERLLELQKHLRHSEERGTTFYYVDVDGLLIHPYIAEEKTSQYSDLRAEIVKHRLFQVPQSMLSSTPLLQCVFRRATGWREMFEYLKDVVEQVAAHGGEDEDGAYRSEFLNMIYEGITKLGNILEACEIDISDSVARSLLRKYLQGERIPFTGEPLEGLQIMGILETRNIDFRNVIILSMTDSNFPGSRASDFSFLPYGLRYGFNLPTAEHHEGVYAYYFYRLISRAESIYMLYSSQTDDKSAGEPSRYIRQLEYETDFKIAHTKVGVRISTGDDVVCEVAKSDRVFEKLLCFTRDKKISPTAFSTYVQCPLRFYFQSVERLYVEDELSEEVDGATFGNILHEAADILYGKIIGLTNPAEHLERYVKSGEIEKIVDEAISRSYFKRDDGELEELSGELLIIRDIVSSYLGRNVAGYDIRHGDFVVFSTEKPVDEDIAIDVGDEQYVVHLGGRPDRIDSLDNGMMRVIDYKTGTFNTSYGGIEKLFGGTADDRNSKIINTLLYAMMISHREHRSVRPELYFVGAMVKEDYSPRFRDTSRKMDLDSFDLCREEFEEAVQRTLREMFDRNTPFRQCEDVKTCTYCPFKEVCHRK